MLDIEQIDLNVNDLIELSKLKRSPKYSFSLGVLGEAVLVNPKPQLSGNAQMVQTDMAINHYSLSCFREQNIGKFVAMGLHQNF